MNLAGNASALSQHSAELRSHPTQAQPKQEPRQQSQAEHKDRVRPVGLIEVWFDVKTESGAVLIPNTIVVTGDYAERVRSWSQISVISDATRTTVDPVLVKAFQLVLK